ncbi:hypothetical protein [Parageobacillus thermoglucosidasius]|nr:hypothetical protein [Parageobacillus thermoglucosidasius]KYD14676.1 hypothetical protein B4168_1885 [Anoxybacillus flavithermus]MED4904200.1 hypothetical protein [Parageobacillus thermoglucosidasius]MED4914767.1 hypothetical protein [Parageobacillus thermoglucosidasius]MED4943591.1 hypothetical protein [Parageobacillus thermoglucosidasius]MED4982678.1 hypothetical protein [Parageobacillus thermoglucosidasius]
MCALFTDGGCIVKEGMPSAMFNHPKYERRKRFLSKVVKSCIFFIAQAKR